MRIAIVGAGISGLTAAYQLAGRHDLTILEAGEHVGGHTNTVDVEIDGERHAIDTGFIVFNERNYPSFTGLLRELDVPTQPTSMSFSVHCERSGLEYNGTSLDTVFAQRRNLLRPAFLRMLLDILRFNREATRAPLPEESVTVQAYVDARGYGARFVEHYLVPLGASLWSCPPRTFRAFPMRFVIEFLSNHAMLQVDGRPTWRVVRGGSARYVERLTAGFRDRVRLGCAVRRIERTPHHVRLRLADGSELTADHAIVACHSDQALSMLADPSPVEREVLGAFPYQPNEALLHTDAAVLPRARRTWAAWNYRIPRDERGDVSVTYNMNILQRLKSSHVFNVTLNDDGRVPERSILRRIAYHHPVFTTGRAAAQRRHPELIDVNRTSFCGAYWGYGFHEDGVRSGLAVSRALLERRAA